MTPTVLLDAPTIEKTVRELGGQIAHDHPEGVVIVGVLKGALLFVSDLVRHIVGVPVEVDFISISRFAPDSGRVKILHDLTIDIGGRDVVLVEDIVDTGLTLAYLTSQLAAREPRSLSACALLDRASRRIVPLPLRYRGVELGDEFVLGYGLHVHDLYRNLPFVVAGDRDDVTAAPDCYVATLYAGGAEAPKAGGSVTADGMEIQGMES